MTETGVMSADMSPLGDVDEICTFCRFLYV